MQFTQRWFDRLIPTLWQTLSELRDRPVLALEIGSYEGYSACWFLRNTLSHPDSRLVCIDDWAGPGHPGEDYDEILKRFWHNIKSLQEEHRVVVVRSNSAEALPLLAGLPRTLTEYCGVDHATAMLIESACRFDLIFVDGSHNALNVYTDAILSHWLLSKGGYLIFDDYDWSDGTPLGCPRIGIDHFLATFGEQYERIETTGWCVVLRKR